MYLVFEGIDGSGKTTLAHLVADRLEEMGITPILLLEPSHGRYGREVRARMASSAPPAELHRLFTRDRKDHVATKIAPLLDFMRSNPGFAIVQDRGYLSAPAYQVTDDQRVPEMLEEQRAIAPRPARFFLIDLPVDTAMDRLAARQGPSSIFERRAFLESVRRRYKMLADDTSEPVTTLDGTLEPCALADNVLSSLQSEFPAVG